MFQYHFTFSAAEKQLELIPKFKKLLLQNDQITLLLTSCWRFYSIYPMSQLKTYEIWTSCNDFYVSISCLITFFILLYRHNEIFFPSTNQKCVSKDVWIYIKRAQDVKRDDWWRLMNTFSLFRTSRVGWVELLAIIWSSMRISQVHLPTQVLRYRGRPCHPEKAIQTIWVNLTQYIHKLRFQVVFFLVVLIFEGYGKIYNKQQKLLLKIL